MIWKILCIILLVLLIAAGIFIWILGKTLGQVADALVGSFLGALWGVKKK